MKLITAFVAAISLASFQTAKSCGGELQCVCDRRVRLLMGLDPIEAGRGLSPGPPQCGLPPQAKGEGLGDGPLPNQRPSPSDPPPNGDSCCLCNEDPFDGKLVPEVICCNQGEGTGGEGNGGTRSLTRVTEDVYSVFTNQTRPQGFPSYEASELVDDDIGLWKLHNFLNEDEVDEMKRVLEDSSNLFLDCKVDYCRPRSGLKMCQEEEDRPSLSQPHGKQCLMVTDRVKKTVSADDAALWDDLTKKYSDVWPEYPFTSPMFVQIQEGKVGPSDFMSMASG